MLTPNQEKYLLTIPDEKIVKIYPYDPGIKNAAKSIIDKIHRAGINLDIKFMGASALGIAGQGDIDLYVLCPEGEFAAYLSKLERVFGRKEQGISLIKWEFIEQGFPVELYLTDPKTLSTREHMEVFRILKSTPKFLKEYEEVKTLADGISFREYMRRKYEFFNKILKNDC